MEKIVAKQIIALKRKTPLQYVSVAEIESLPAVHAKARYLYWACYRGHANLVKIILEQDKISPFARIYEGRSPMMASLLGKQAPLKNQQMGSSEEAAFSPFINNRSQIEICCREYIYEKDEHMLEQ